MRQHSASRLCSVHVTSGATNSSSDASIYRPCRYRYYIGSISIIEWWCQIDYVGLYSIFSKTWLRYVWLYIMVWQIRLSVCRLWRACTLLSGVNFSGIILHHICRCSLAIRQLAHQKSRRSSKGRSCELRIKQANSHVWLSHLLMSFL